MRRLRLAGLLLTLLAVALLSGSLLEGLGGGGSPQTLANRARPDRRIRLEVLNAAGVPGLARQVTERLRAEGYDVVYYGNAPAAFGRDSSVVIDRIGDPAVARDVADRLGIPRMRSTPDTALYLEATVVVGRDWRGADSGTRR